MLAYLEIFAQICVSVLVLVQCLVVYFLAPEDAKKFNFVGKALDYLSNTKKGISCKECDGKICESDNIGDSGCK